MAPGIIFEVVPPSRLASQETKNKALESIVSAINKIPKIDYVNIPEVAEESNRGRPFYRNVDILEFSEKLKSSGVKSEIIVNKTVAYQKDMKEFNDWMGNATKKVKHFIFVGGNKSSHQYPGPSVMDATRFAIDRYNVKVGNICIPFRQNEAERMLKKTIAGASFFTSQLIFSADSAKRMLMEYDQKCSEMGVKSGEVYLSFCVVSNPTDLEFVEWLEAEVPADVKKRLQIGDMAKNSVAISAEVWNDIKDFAKSSGIKTKIGLNIEEIFLHNIPPTIELVKKIA